MSCRVCYTCEKCYTCEMECGICVKCEVGVAVEQPQVQPPTRPVERKPPVMQPQPQPQMMPMKPLTAEDVKQIVMEMLIQLGLVKPPQKRQVNIG